MPRVYNRTSSRGSWTQESLQNAIKAILEDKMKIREAGRTFNIPEGTLRRRLVSKNFEKRNMGPSSCLGRETESKLVKHIGFKDNFALRQLTQPRRVRWRRADFF